MSSQLRGVLLRVSMCISCGERAMGLRHGDQMAISIDDWRQCNVSTEKGCSCGRSRHECGGCVWDGREQRKVDLT